MNVAKAPSFAYFTLLVLAVPSSAPAGEPLVDAYADAIQALLHDRFAESNAGMVIGLLDEHGSRVFSAGKLDNGGDQEVDGDTIFELGSVTKVFTVLLLLDAVRRGEMKLDDPVTKYLPERVNVSAHGGKEITLGNLAAQDSGLPFHPDNLRDKPVNELTLKEVKEGGDAYTVEKMYAFLSGYKLTQDPGASFEYSNVGMALLGHAIERKTGADYESLIVERICRPLKMDNTRITLSSPLKARLARGNDDNRVDATEVSDGNWQRFPLIWMGRICIVRPLEPISSTSRNRLRCRFHLETGLCTDGHRRRSLFRQTWSDPHH